MRWFTAALLLLAACLCVGLGSAAGQVATANDAPAPALFRAQFHTTGGDFVIEVHRDWAPYAADRFHALVQSGYYNGNAFFRVVAGFVAQWGINPIPAQTAAWQHMTLPDDPVLHSNRRGTVSFAASGKHSRDTQVFINLGDNARLDRSGFAPFGLVVSGLENAELFYSGYGDNPPNGHGPNPARAVHEGAAYVSTAFPKLDVILDTRILPLQGQNP